MKMTISVGRSLKRKTMLVWVKEYINKNFATCKSICNLQELYTAFKEKHPNVNTRFSKFSKFLNIVPWYPNSVFWLAKKWLTMFEFVALIKCYVARRCSWLGLDIQRPDQEDRLKPWEQQLHHASVWTCPGTAFLKEFLDQELNEHEDD